MERLLGDAAPDRFPALFTGAMLVMSHLLVWLSGRQRFSRRYRSSRQAPGKVSRFCTGRFHWGEISRIGGKIPGWRVVDLSVPRAPLGASGRLWGGFDPGTWAESRGDAGGAASSEDRTPVMRGVFHVEQGAPAGGFR